MIRTTFMVLMMLAAAFSSTADTGWGTHTEAGEWAFARGDFEKAEAEFRTALEIAQELPEGDPRLERSLRNLGLFFEHRSRIDEAEPIFFLLLAAQEHRLGLESPALLETLAAVARTAIPSGDLPAALASLGRFVTIADSSGAADEEQLRIVLGMLARIYLIEDRGEEALKAQRRATAMTTDNPGLEAEERSGALESLAQMELRFGDPEAALIAYDQVAGIRLEADPEADVSPIFAAGARTAVDAGEIETASKLAERALATASDSGAIQAANKVLSDVAWMRVRRGSASVADLAAVEADSGDLLKADTALSALLADQTSSLTTGDPARIETLSRLVAVAVMQKDIDKAAATQQKLCEAYAASTGPGSAPTLQALRAVVDIQLIDPTRVQQGADANAALLTAQESAWGETDPRLLPTLELQYELLRVLKQKKQAKVIKKRIRKLE